VATVVPDYAVLDLRMPGANGIDILTFLKRTHPHCVGDGNISEAARRLNLNRRSLQRKLKKYPPEI
jgi:ActR/RegA family two-component response regulator